ncbi:MAG: sulfatase-like hydrolase/transferase, partial [Promethearchaeota archaeon]
MNIILLTIDCLRADHVGCLGYPRPTTSYIDRLAEGAGVVFRQAVANGPKTLASFPSILASVYPLWQGPSARLSVGRRTLAEALGQAGYTTVAYHSNPYLSREYGYDRGFHAFDDTLKDVSRGAVAARRVRSFIPKNSPIYRVLRRVNRLMNVKSLAPPFVSGDVITDRGLKWLSRADGRLFLWLHYMDAHYPYVPPREYVEPFVGQYPSARNQARIFAAMLEEPNAITTEEIELLVGLYDAQICHVDACAGRIIDAVWERGLHDQTVIAVTSDHGEEFREHGDFSHATSLHSRRS